MSRGYLALFMKQLKRTSYSASNVVINSSRMNLDKGENPCEVHWSPIVTTAACNEVVNWNPFFINSNFNQTFSLPVLFFRIHAFKSDFLWVIWRVLEVYPNFWCAVKSSANEWVKDQEQRLVNCWNAAHNRYSTQLSHVLLIPMISDKCGTNK